MCRYEQKSMFLRLSAISPEQNDPIEHHEHCVQRLSLAQALRVEREGRSETARFGAAIPARSGAQRRSVNDGLASG
jgi:hypothetical protein